jgi:hypothetical protein
MSTGLLGRGRLDTPGLRSSRSTRTPGSSRGQNQDWLSSTGSSDSVLHAFLASSQPWGLERLPVPRRLQLMLWLLIPVELCWAIWLATIVSGAGPCDGQICMVATLHHHATALLACGVFCVAALVGLIPTTRGFSKCNGIEVIGLALASAAGGASFVGIAALIVGALTACFLLATFVIAYSTTSRRETDHARAKAPFPIAFLGGVEPSRARRVKRPNQRKVA